jgi:hypothetical protein
MDCAYNTLQSNKFLFRLDRIPETSFFVTEAEIPSISIPMIDSPYQGDSTNSYPGSSISYETMSLRFQVDENLANWLEIYNWMQSIAYDRRDTTDLAKQYVSDALLTTLTNNSNINVKLKFTDCYPISMGQISFSTQEEAAPVFCSLTLAYTRYYVEP